MSYPADALQKGIFDALTADAALATAMGGTVRAYDRVKPDVVFPYITFADAQIVDDSNTCDDDAYEAFVDLQVWSRAVGQVEAKMIAGAARAAMASLVVTGWTVPIVQCRSVSHFMDPDGLTARARLNFRILLETA